MRHYRVIQAIFDWRSWPTIILYFPIIIYSFLFGLFNGSKVFFFTLVNPDIPLGGFAGESKYNLLMQLEEDVRPKTILISHSCSVNHMLDELHEAGLSYPLVAKPDSSEGGFLVQKIENQFELEKYHADHAINYLIQEFVHGPQEYSILFHKLYGHYELTSFTEKKPLSINGDGVSTIFQLLNKHPRARNRLSYILSGLSDTERVLDKDESFEVDFRANVDCGAAIIDRRSYMVEELRRNIEKIMKNCPAVFYGRLDIKSNNLNNVIKGTFKIVEINGVKGEALHIYDRDFNIIRAYQEIFKHWTIILRLAKQNLRNGYKCPSMVHSIKLLKAHRDLRLNANIKRYA
jgi:hypothetical protein